MKKIYTIVLFILTIITLSSCGKTYAYKNEIKMTLTSEWIETITHKGAVPYRLFNFDGTLNVYETSTSMGYVFTKNDNYFLSSALEKHLKEVVKDNYIIVEAKEQGYDKDYAVFGKEKKPIDEGTKSMEYSIVTWDNDGTRYSYLYRKFTSGGVDYYIYCYHTGITMSIDIPLLVQKVDEKQQIFMISLPYDTRYTLNVNTKIKSLKNKAEYLEDKYHHFNYPDYLTEENRVSGVKNWYINYCHGEEVNGLFTFIYLGIKYKVEFGDNDFSIYVLEV